MVVAGIVANTELERLIVQDPLIETAPSLNGVKDFKRQMVVAHEVLEMIAGEPDLKKMVKGFMLESFTQGGNQKLDLLTAETIDRGGLSITDPCLSWEDTEKLILEICQKLK